MQLRVIPALILISVFALSGCTNNPFQLQDPEKEIYQIRCKPRGVLGLMGFYMDNANHCTKGYTPP